MHSTMRSRLCQELGRTAGGFAHSALSPRPSASLLRDGW